MIQFVTGVVGAGKTLHSVRLGIEAMMTGRTIVTNVKMYPDRIIETVARRFGRRIRPEQFRIFDPEVTPNWQGLIPWGDRSCPVLVILDETQLFYNARDWAKTAEQSRSLLSFLTQSRKAGVDVLWITQEGENVDKQFRVLAEWELALISTDHLPLGFLGKLPFRAYICKKISAKGRYLVSKSWHGYDKWLFGLYETEAFLNTEMRRLAEGVERVGRAEVAKVGLMERGKLHVRHWMKTLRRQSA